MYADEVYLSYNTVQLPPLLRLYMYLGHSTYCIFSAGCGFPMLMRSMVHRARGAMEKVKEGGRDRNHLQMINLLRLLSCNFDSRELIGMTVIVSAMSVVL
jgi:hypothetical protein